jgi:hypothetical protein
MAQVVEWEALSSNPSTEKKKNHKTLMILKLDSADVGIQYTIFLFLYIFIIESKQEKDSAQRMFILRCL